MDDFIRRADVIEELETVGYDFSESGFSQPELAELCEAVGDVREDTIRRIKRLPSAEPEQRWIPRSERLPQNDGLYLVWGTSGGADEFPEEDPHAFLIDYDSCAGAFGYWYETFDFGILNGKTGEEFQEVNVIAWQPIESYGGDDDDE